MKIAILYICTGKYTVYWKQFYESCEKYFLFKHSKSYFVFTDNNNFEYSEKENIIWTKQHKLGWPHDTLMRFDMFLKVEKQLEKFDYIFFFNANMHFVKEVYSDEILPNAIDCHLMGVIHPFFTLVTNPEDFPYERNKKSLAYISKKHGENYFMGGLNGGKSKKYLELINKLNINIKKDEEKGIIAKWHDESHLNNYFLNKNIKKLSPIYGCPEGMEDKFPNPKIIILDKEKFGGHDLLREKKESIPVSKNHKSNILKRIYRYIKNKLKS